jgi:predicted Zn-dependent protease
MAREELTNVSSMPRFLKLAVRHITVNTVYVRPTRNFEAEADSLGIQYLYKSGYDPQGLASFLERVKVIREKKADGRTNGIDALQMNQRVQAIQHQIKTLSPVADYKADTMEFQVVKKMLSALPEADQH